MSKSTIFFAGIALILLLAVSVTVAQIFRTPGNKVAGAKMVGTMPPLGLNSDRDNPGSSNLASAQSAILWDSSDNKIMYQQNSFERMPIASLTKLMTAMVALDRGIAWDKTSTIAPEDDVIGGNLMLFRGETVTMRDLFNASLLGSANNATLAYARSLGMTDEEFVEAMNRKAVEIGLEQTQFVGITGLDKRNISTAYEVAKMAHYAFSHYPEIAKATNQKEYTFTIQGSGREHTIHNTNKLISEQDMSFLGSKTGFLYESGYCLVVEGRDAQKDLVAVVLKSPSEEQHFIDIKRLMSLPAEQN